MTWQLWLELHLHFCMLSLLAVGGALAIVPEMHRYLVNDLQVLTETAFSQSVICVALTPGAIPVAVAKPFSMAIALNSAALLPVFA